MGVEDVPAGIRRACIAIAAARLARPAQNGLPEPGADDAYRRRLTAAFARSCVAAGIDRALIDDQLVQAEQVAVLPPGIDEPRVLAKLIAELTSALGRFGAQRAGSRMRLVMAVHEGLTTLSGDGFSGEAVAKARRLADSDELHGALAGQPDTDLMVLLSERIYEDLSELDRPALSPSRFRRIEIVNSASGQPDIGWIFVPAASETPGGTVSEREENPDLAACERHGSAVSERERGPGRCGGS